MKAFNNIVDGPFKDEGEFKQAVLKVWRKRDLSESTHFEIENEEKEPGMPDCMSISPKHVITFTEFKISSENGVITFKKSQPLFYKKHENMPIVIFAWDRRYNHVVMIHPREVVAAKSLRIKLPEDL